MLRKEIKDLNKQRDILDLWVGILNTVKVSILPKLINMFKAMPIKIPARFFVGINIILKFIWKGKETKVVETILKKKNKVENISPSNFETYYIATLIKTGWQDRYIDQWNIIDSPETNQHKQDQLIFGKSTKAIQWKKDSLSINSAGTSGHS